MGIELPDYRHEIAITSEEEFRELVAKFWPEAKIIKETGAGETYCEDGDLVAAIGPPYDMQAQVVGVWTEDGYAPPSYNGYVGIPRELFEAGEPCTPTICFGCSFLKSFGNVGELG
jgi:hypothetical protein